jgi:hypothetical protein
VTAGILPEIAEAAVPETTTVAEATVPEPTTITETTIAEAATIAETAIPEDRGVPEERRPISEDARDTAVQEKLGRRRGHFLGAKLGEAHRPILQIAAGKRHRVAHHFSRFGRRGARYHNRTQRGESAPCEGA